MLLFVAVMYYDCVAMARPSSSSLSLLTYSVLRPKYSQRCTRRRTTERLRGVIAYVIYSENTWCHDATSRWHLWRLFKSSKGISYLDWALIRRNLSLYRSKSSYRALFSLLIKGNLKRKLGVYRWRSVPILWQNLLMRFIINPNL